MNANDLLPPELLAAIESEAAPLGIKLDTAIGLYYVDDAFRARVEEYRDAMQNAPDWAGGEMEP